MKNPSSPRTIKIKVSKTLQGKIRKGYPWVFYYQIHNRKISGEAGDLGVIYDDDNKFLAVGLYDPYSDIRLRILQSGKPAEVGRDFFREQFENALASRRDLERQGTTGYRVLNGENDGFPGLVLDRYGDTAVMKIYAVSWFPHLGELLPALQDGLPVRRCVLLLSRHAERTVPGSGGEYRNGQTLFGPPLDSSARFSENGLCFEADVVQGQKTGFFLDQRENRQRVRALARGKTVLNAFSYTGGFSVYAFAGGCRSVLEIDANRHALEAARNNLELNFPADELARLDYRQMQGDAFQLFAQLEKENKTFDLVILDPPAFAKNSKHKKSALLAYTRLARAGAKRTNDGGILVASSCSAPVSANEFYRAAELGIKASGKGHEELSRTGHAIDHPVSFKEGAYLKTIYCRISGKKKSGGEPDRTTDEI
ncbi:MAG: class I SAM-dependent methyltransferase [Nitrospinae bacterium]|nr:class I SAM-dependent methyltransferase [Nitrospinota bacterium]